MKGASVKVAILSFFSSHGLYFHHAKNQPLLRPPSPFSEHLLLFWPYLFSKKIYETFLVHNLGHNHLKKCNICCLGGLLKEKRESTSDLFSTFQKPYWPSCPIVHWVGFIRGQKNELCGRSVEKKQIFWAKNAAFWSENPFFDMGPRFSSMDRL